MKTFLVIYVLAFVSIMVLYVHEHRTPEAQGGFDVSSLIEAVKRLKPAPRTEAPPGKPEPVTVPLERTGRNSAGNTERELSTFEELDLRILGLSEKLEENPVLVIDIAEAYREKARLYQVGIESLTRQMPLLDREERGKFAARRGIYEGMRIESLWLAIGALGNLDNNRYGDKDLRWLKAEIYLELPDMERLAITELRKIASDPDVSSEMREKALGIIKDRKR